jgi:hypothetical protein
MGIVSFVGLELDHSEHAQLKEKLAEYSEDLESPEFSLTPLPALKQVEKIHLKRFLSDTAAGADCPADLVGELSELIYKETGGIYEKAMFWLRTGRETTWTQVLEELKSKQVETEHNQGR